MDQQSIRVELLAALSKRYEEDLRQFVTVPQPLMQLCMTRTALAELRNGGYVEEQTRGVVRLRPQGYMMYQKEYASGNHRDE
jgi:hypothetical protein